MRRAEERQGAIGLDELNFPLLTLGLLMVGFGALVPGTQPTAVTALILIGSAFLAAAVLAPIYREFEISPTKVRFTQGEATSVAPWVVGDSETLTNIASLALGDSRLARDAVENALSMVRRVRRRLAVEDREPLKLKALVASLDKADHKRRLAGGWSAEAGSSASVHQVLQSLTFPVRIAFALRSELPLKDVAEILDRPEEEIEARIRVAEAALSSVVEEERSDD